MKKTIILLAFIAFFSSTFSATTSMSASVPPLSIKANEVYLPVGKTGRLISLMDLSRISVKDFEKLAGKKMKFLDKMTFKMGQRKLKKKYKPGWNIQQKKR